MRGLVSEIYGAVWPDSGSGMVRHWRGEQNLAMI